MNKVFTVNALSLASRTIAEFTVIVNLTTEVKPEPLLPFLSQRTCAQRINPENNVQVAIVFQSDTLLQLSHSHSQGNLPRMSPYYTNSCKHAKVGSCSHATIESMEYYKSVILSNPKKGLEILQNAVSWRM